MTAPRTRSGWVELAAELLRQEGEITPDQELLDWLDERRKEEPFRPKVAWKTIGDELAHVTKGRVAINWNSLREYYVTNRGGAS